MLTHRFLLGRARDALSEEERQVVEESVSAVRMIPARTTIQRRGELVTSSTLLLDGFMCRYLDDREGYRQLVSVHVPGDFVDLHGFPLKRLDHDVATLGPCTVATFEHRTIAHILERHPRLMRWLWFSTMLDAAIHREWIFRMGRLGAEGRVAHLFCELYARLEMVGLAESGRYSFPATQADLAEACGITGVHVNRVLRLMRERDLATFRSGEVRILDQARLCKLAEFDPVYLYGQHSMWVAEPVKGTADG
ncbi:Crp/Fnr family transcriptional regulator [Sphingomonas sp.]|jgi:CRP-like cAMP-binding protein|uniref:Crp/Fnr family transcriptional regulator n=1 Tax=Sphingomonas sp. TaxID=28214 RepID=UPI002D810529|nr:Crp/Fnr family transcriptional regulator [Sphingomonas sp.]HEU0044588.1 Crp/Fnr family transcriptional regulator [Sphingomonas sp.]